MMKRIFAFILVLALAMSCAFAAEPEVGARSATVKVTVLAYELSEKMLHSSDVASGSLYLARFTVDDVSEQVTNPIRWAFKANGETISYTSSDADGNNAVVSTADVKKLATGLVTTITIVGTATIPTPGGDINVTSDPITIKIVNDEGNKPIKDPEKTDPDGDGNKEGDDATTGGAIAIAISCPATVKDGDKVSVAITPTIPAEVAEALNILSPDQVVITVYMAEGENATGEEIGTSAYNVEDGTAETVYSPAVDVSVGTYYFWATIKATGNTLNVGKIEK